MSRPSLRVVRRDDPPGPPPEPQEPGWPPFIASWLLPYLKEPALWPVALAVLGHVVVVLVPLLLAVARVGSGWAAACLGVAAALSLLPVRWELRAEGRPAGATAVVVGVWLTSLLTAAAADRWGIL